MEKGKMILTEVFFEWKKSVICFILSSIGLMNEMQV